MSELHPYTEDIFHEKWGRDRMVLMARDPHWLYAYWEISENTKNMLSNDFGKDFLEKSVPVLKITNITRNQSFYVRINDFSDNWYVNVPHSNSIYVAEIGRRISENFFVSILDSNSVITQNDGVSSDTTAYFADYMDIRNGKPDAITQRIYVHQVIKQTEPFSGTSSLEFAEYADEAASGRSSWEIYGQDYY